MTAKADKKREPHRVGWIRVTPRYPGTAQRQALEAVPCHANYSAADGETLADLLNHVRTGNEVYVLGLHRLGATRAELAGALDHFRRVGVRLYDIEAGAWVDVASFAAVADALRVIAGEARIEAVDVAKRRGTYGGGRKIKDGAMSRVDAERIWTDRAVPSNAEAATLTGWSLRSLHRAFGASGRPAGWPKKPQD